MTLKEFLRLMRAKFGYSQEEAWWRYQFQILPDRSLEGVKNAIPILAIRVRADTLSSRTATYYGRAK